MSKKYPKIAGAHRDALITSRAAANAIEDTGRAETLRERALHWYRRGNKGTADDCAKALNESILAIRPRVTELFKQKLLMPTGERRISSGGRNASVMKIQT